MKVHRRAPEKINKPKRVQAQAYRNLEIAMEKRALVTHPATNKETQHNEVTDWSEAETDTLEG